MSAKDEEIDIKLRLPRELADEVDDLARRYQRSRVGEIRYAILRHIERRKERDEALDEV